MTVWTIISILGVTVVIVVGAVAVDVARDYLDEKKAEREVRRKEKDEFDEWALNMLTIAGLNKTAHAVYRREQGMHRRVRV